MSRHIQSAPRPARHFVSGFNAALIILAIAVAPVASLAMEPVRAERSLVVAQDVENQPAAAVPNSEASAPGSPPRTVTEFAKITPSDGYPVAFGASIAVGGFDLVVGAPGYITEDGVVGTAYVFHRVGPRWVEIGKLFPDFGGIDGEDFGLTVAIDGDYIVVGAPHIIAGRIGGGYGRAFIFRRYDKGTPEDPLDDEWWEDAEFRSPDEIRDGDMYGYSVAISDGVALIGKPGSVSWLSGAAYVYRNINGVWRHVGSLYPSDSALGDQFGNAVSLSGNIALIDARHHVEGGLRRGGAYVFWETMNGWSEELKLVPEESPTFGGFGRSVCVTDTHAVIGAGGRAYAYAHRNQHLSHGVELTAPESTSDFALRVACYPDLILSSDAGSGDAHLFCSEEASWVHCRRLVVGNQDSGGALIFPVAIDAKYAFIAGGPPEAIYVYVTPSAAKSLSDYSRFQLCFRREERKLNKECTKFDFAPDGQIDLRDFNELLARLAGP